MTTVEVKSTITVKLGAHVFDLTRAEAQTLFNALKRELEVNPYATILNPNNILNRKIDGPFFGNTGPMVPTFAPNSASPLPPSTIVC